MPTSDNSSDEHEKSMCESDASDVSVTEHITPLHTGEGPGVGLYLFININLKLLHAARSPLLHTWQIFESLYCLFGTQVDDEQMWC